MDENFVNWFLNTTNLKSLIKIFGGRVVNGIMDENFVAWFLNISPSLYLKNLWGKLWMKMDENLWINFWTPTLVIQPNFGGELWMD
jgi:hypothetical protein